MISRKLIEHFHSYINYKARPVCAASEEDKDDDDDAGDERNDDDDEIGVFGLLGRAHLDDLGVERAARNSHFRLVST